MTESKRGGTCDEPRPELVIPPRGPRTQRASGAGKHAQGTPRRRTRGQNRRAVIREEREQD